MICTLVGVGLLGHGGASWFPLAMPPVHPILVNFTAALVPTSFAADVLARWSKRGSFLAVSWWTLLLAAAVTPLTALAGWWWMRQMPEMNSSQMSIHKWLGISITVVLILWAVWRGSIYRRAAAPGALYLIATGLLVGSLMVQGHLGGTMSFGSGGDDATDRPPNHLHAMPATTPTADDRSIGHAEHAHGPLHWSDHLDVPVILSPASTAPAPN